MSSRTCVPAAERASADFSGRRMTVTKPRRAKLRTACGAFFRKTGTFSVSRFSLQVRGETGAFGCHLPGERVVVVEGRTGG